MRDSLVEKCMCLLLQDMASSCPQSTGLIVDRLTSGGDYSCVTQRSIVLSLALPAACSLPDLVSWSGPSGICTC